MRQGKQQQVPAKFVPWRFRSKEGWDVLIGRSSEANDDCYRARIGRETCRPLASVTVSSRIASAALPRFTGVVSTTLI